ncbi:phosphoglycerate dehydrogenase [Candidatus Kaiserbacteria bacterium]|nr:phosphoglycerate dehydrogenase [Candidatus Kaiserbacteria bacterium]
MLTKPDFLARIGTLNNIAPAGLNIFGNTYLVRKEMESPDALIVRSAKVGPDQFPGFAIARAGIGVNNIDVEEATRLGICVFNTPGGNARAVAELVTDMIGAQSRHVFAAVQFARSLYGYTDPHIEEMVEQKKKDFVGNQLAGKTLGVIGLGKIGVLVANLGIHQGMRVIGLDTMLTVPNAHQLSPQVELAKTLEQVLEAAHFVTVHVPLVPENKHLINGAQIPLMRNGATLVNYARREICDEKAVLAGIESGKLAAYITDFPTKELVAHPRVIATPHLGASTEESEETCAVMAARQLRDFFESGTVVNSVNFPTVELVPDRAVRTRLVVVNRDVPNMIAEITSALGENGINIARSRNESNGKIGYNLIDVNGTVPHDIVDRISAVDNVLKVRAIPMNR